MRVSRDSRVFTRKRCRRCCATVQMGHSPAFIARKVRNRKLIVEVLILWQVFGIDVDEFRFAEVGDAKFAENVVDDGGRKFDSAVI